MEKNCGSAVKIANNTKAFEAILSGKKVYLCQKDGKNNIYTGCLKSASEACDYCGTHMKVFKNNRDSFVALTDILPRSKTDPERRLMTEKDDYFKNTDKETVKDVVKGVVKSVVKETVKQIKTKASKYQYIVPLEVYRFDEDPEKKIDSTKFMKAIKDYHGGNNISHLICDKDKNWLTKHEDIQNIKMVIKKMDVVITFETKKKLTEHEIAMIDDDISGGICDGWGNSINTCEYKDSKKKSFNVVIGCGGDLVEVV